MEKAQATAPKYPICLVMIQKSQTAVNVSANPSMCLTSTIQGPGLGKICTNFGNNAKNKYGIEKPRPSVKNIKKMSSVVPAKANPTAVPRKGAEHGVESKVAKTPEKKYSENPDLICDLLINPDRK